MQCWALCTTINIIVWCWWWRTRAILLLYLTIVDTKSYDSVSYRAVSRRYRSSAAVAVFTPCRRYYFLGIAHSRWLVFVGGGRFLVASPALIRLWLPPRAQQRPQQRISATGYRRPPTTNRLPPPRHNHRLDKTPLRLVLLFFVIPWILVKVKVKKS